MGFLIPYVSTASLLCEESSESLFGLSDGEGEEPELNMNLDLPSYVGLSLESSDDLVGSLMQQEKEQLACIATGNYLERLNNGGVESAWRADSIEWFGQVQARHHFGPLCVYLATNYLDRFLAVNLPDDKAWWAQLILSVGCLSIAAKMEETTVPSYVDFQARNVTQTFDVETVERMEVFVMRSLNWRMNAATPFSYISYFADKFNDGNPLTNESMSRCTELILGTMKETKFLQFMPSEIAAAVILCAVAETKVFNFSDALSAVEIPVDKEKVRICHEAIMQEVALVETTNPIRSASPSVPQSPSDRLNALLRFTSATDDSQTLGSSEATNVVDNANSYQPSSPVSKRTRIDQV